MQMLRYGNLCTEFARCVVAVATSEQTKEIAEKHMRAMDKELAELKKANAEALKRKSGRKMQKVLHMQLMMQEVNLPKKGLDL